MFGLKSEFAQVRNVFRNLGSLYFFSSEDLMDEVVVLKPETFVNSIFDLIRNARAVRTHSSNSVPPSPSGSVPPSPPNSLPPSPSTPRSSSHSAPPLLSTSNSYPSSPPPLFLNESDAQEPTVQNMAGIFPHSKLKEVWGMDTSYFSDVLALLERSGVLFNFYTSSPGVGKFPMHAKLASHVSYSPSTGYALIPTHLPPAPRSSDLGSLWHPLPEASLAQYGRKYMFELLPRGIFGTLVSRTAQFARMVRCWENSAIFIPDDISSDSNLLSVERVWIRFIPHQRRLDIMSRVPLSSVPTLAHLVIRMAEGFLIDKTSVSVPCSHCARVPDPYSFSLPVLWSGDKVVTCQRNATGPPTHANAAQAQDSASSASGASASAGGSVAVSVRSVLVEVAVLQASNHVIPYNELELDTLPLTGSKRIYLGSYHNQTVVYKLFQPKQSNTVDRKTVLEFCNEVMSLRQLQHPGVIKMHGMCFNPLAIVMECISFVRSSALTLQQFLVDKKQDAEWSKRISIALSIAETMEYFHSLNPQFCHINLRSANILLGKQEDRILVKLTHFGHSGILPIVVPENLPQPAVWCAPEIIQLGQINDKSDVYSFGVVLWELAARAEYLADVKTSDQLLELVNNGQLPNAPTGCPEPLGELIMNCLHRDANKRPSFTSIIASLQQLQGNIVEWNLQQFRGQALMATPPLNWGTELVSLDPSMNAIHKLSIDSVTLEDSLDSVMNDMKGSTFQGLLQHMKNEMSDEVFQFYQQVRLFKQLNMLAPEEQALAKASAKQIWEIYIDNGAPRQINISAPIRESLHGAIFSMLPISANIFQAAEEHVRPLLEDSFRRYKKNHKGYGSVTWERQECGGNIPPPMVGHTVVLHRDKIVVVGGWANNRWSCDTIYKLHRKNFKWCKHTCTGDIPPPSGGAATATIVGNTIMYCCLPNYVYQLFLDTNRWVALKCNIVPASAGFADNLRNSLTPTPPPQDPKDSFNTNANPLQTSTSYPSPTKKLPTFGFLSPRSKKHLVFPS